MFSTVDGEGVREEERTCCSNLAKYIIHIVQLIPGVLASFLVYLAQLVAPLKKKLVPSQGLNNSFSYIGGDNVGLDEVWYSISLTPSRRSLSRIT